MVIYKITTFQEWNAALAKGEFSGSALDIRDGFIHLSTVSQAPDTARLHFAGQPELVLVAISANTVALHLKWEASRGGELFPHVYGPLQTSDILWVKPLPWNGTAHAFPEGFKA